MSLSTRFLVLFMMCAGYAQAAETSSSATADPIVPSDMRRVARKVESDLAGKVERLPQYINFLSREVGNDSRICAFDVTAEADHDRRIVLHGFVEFPETRKALNEFLAALGFEVDDQLEALPAASLGKQIFGVAKSKTSHQSSTRCAV